MFINYKQTVERVFRLKKIVSMKCVCVRLHWNNIFVPIIIVISQYIAYVRVYTRNTFVDLLYTITQSYDHNIFNLNDDKLPWKRKVVKSTMNASMWKVSWWHQFVQFLCALLRVWIRISVKNPYEEMWRKSPVFTSKTIDFGRMWR